MRQGQGDTHCKRKEVGRLLGVVRLQPHRRVLARQDVALPEGGLHLFAPAAGPSRRRVGTRALPRGSAD